MLFTSRPLLALALAGTLAVAGCNSEQPEIVPAARAIKTYTVTEVASGQARKFSGQVYANRLLHPELPGRR